MISSQAYPIHVTIQPKQSFPVDVIGSYIKILYCDSPFDPIISFDNGASFPIPEGGGMPAVQFSANGKTLEPVAFEALSIYNPGDTVMEIKAMVSLGKMDYNPDFIEGIVQVDPCGIPEPTGYQAADAANGITVVLGEKVREVIVHVDAANPVIFEGENGQTMFPRAAGSLSVLHWRSCSFKIKGDGATAYVSVTVVEAD